MYMLTFHNGQITCKCKWETSIQIKFSKNSHILEPFRKFGEMFSSAFDDVEKKERTD